MKKRKFKAIIYLISFTVLITVGIQVYRNVQNYNLNKQRFINDVQVALDNGVEGYFSSLAKGFVFLDSNDSGAFDTSEIKAFIQHSIEGKKSDSLKKFEFSTNAAFSSDTSIGGVTIRSTGKGDSRVRLLGTSKLNNSAAIKSISISKDTIPSTRLNELEAFTAKIMISMVQDSIDFEILTKYVKKELGRKKIDIDFAFASLQNNEIVERSRVFSDDEFSLSTLSKASYLPQKELKMYFDNASLIILKRGMVDLLISLLISVSVIGSLLYLYKIINQQKHLAEIKNDLISNITHEFKTPIATVTSALEAIANFNQQNDPEKTSKYLDMSNDQLKKLNLMVEKLLETATLDSDELSLRKESVNLTLLLSTMIEKYKMLAGEKRLSFVSPSTDVIIEADPFHLENALSNLVDNAIKYGGNEIQVILTQLGGRAQVIVQDNGGFIERSQKERVFDKFYRIPTGNQHDVKGFGIGLYYSRKIIEKHGGSIDLVLKPQLTSFEVAFFMTDKIKILLAEDETALGTIIKESLETRGFEVLFCTNGEQALSTYRSENPELLVLDVMMPKKDGFTLVKEIRKENEKIPVIFLTSKSRTEDVVEGFGLGGNDYLKKPFSMEELIVRIHALLDRKRKRESSEEVNIGKYRFNLSKQKLGLGEKEQTLTHREAQLLFHLSENRNAVTDRSLILTQLWGNDDFFNARSMDVFITKLRKKLSEDESVEILNVRGYGYKLVC